MVPSRRGRARRTLAGCGAGRLGHPPLHASAIDEGRVDDVCGHPARQGVRAVHPDRAILSGVAGGRCRAWPWAVPHAVQGRERHHDPTPTLEPGHPPHPSGGVRFRHAFDVRCRRRRLARGGRGGDAHPSAGGRRACRARRLDGPRTASRRRGGDAPTRCAGHHIRRRAGPCPRAGADDSRGGAHHSRHPAPGRAAPHGRAPRVAYDLSVGPAFPDRTLVPGLDASPGPCHPTPGLRASPARDLPAEPEEHLLPAPGGRLRRPLPRGSVRRAPLMGRRPAPPPNSFSPSA